jgi:hypothetical protein
VQNAGNGGNGEPDRSSHAAAPDQRQPGKHDGERDQRLDHGNVELGDVDQNASHRQGDESRNHDQRSLDKRSADAEGHDEGQMIETDDGVAEAGQQALHEGAGKLAVHDVMGHGGRSG